MGDGAAVENLESFAEDFVLEVDFKATCLLVPVDKPEEGVVHRN